MGTAGVSMAVAVPAAVVAAACMGLASAAQARATKQVPTSRTLHPRLFVDLVRQPLWLIGIGATIAGLGLQVLALGFGPLILVQPLLVTALPFGGFFAALLVHRRPDRVMVLGAFTCVAGLSAFLLLARPTGGVDRLINSAPLGRLAMALGVIAVAGLMLSMVVRGPIRVLGLALATGVFYGLTAGLMKIVAGELRQGLAEPFGHWTLYAVCVIGPIGFLLSQNTFQQGTMMSPALAVITTVDPLVGVAIGVWWLGESAATGPGVLAGEVAAAAVITFGIGVLARRADHLVHRQSDPATHREPPAGAPPNSAEQAAGWALDR
ncbi:MAG TPA: DMT family transporter [Pseudonocardiaceae bacterium]